jgi:hypothetical protein
VQISAMLAVAVSQASAKKLAGQAYAYARQSLS